MAIPGVNSPLPALPISAKSDLAYSTITLVNLLVPLWLIVARLRWRCLGVVSCMLQSRRHFDTGGAVSVLQDSASLQLFRALDTNGNGIIEKTELLSFCSSVNLPVAKVTHALGTAVHRVSAR